MWIPRRSRRKVSHCFVQRYCTKCSVGNFCMSNSFGIFISSSGKSEALNLLNWKEGKYNKGRLIYSLRMWWTFSWEMMGHLECMHWYFMSINKKEKINLRSLALYALGQVKQYWKCTLAQLHTCMKKCYPMRSITQSLSFNLFLIWISSLCQVCSCCCCSFCFVYFLFFSQTILVEKELFLGHGQQNTGFKKQVKHLFNPVVFHRVSGSLALPKSI